MNILAKSYEIVIAIMIKYTHGSSIMSINYRYSELRQAKNG